MKKKLSLGWTTTKETAEISQFKSYCDTPPEIVDPAQFASISDLLLSTKSVLSTFEAKASQRDQALMCNAPT